MVRTNTEDMSNDATIETLTKELTEDISNDAAIETLTKELTEVSTEELTDDQIDTVAGGGAKGLAGGVRNPEVGAKQHDLLRRSQAGCLPRGEPARSPGERRAGRVPLH